MKKLLYLIIFLPFLSFAQHVTTDVEYNYLTKGYAADISEGRDLKSGYTLSPIGTEMAVNTYTFQFSSFVKNDEKQVAAILVVAKSKTWNNTYYLCIPIGSQELFQKYLNDLTSWDAGISKSYAYVSSVLMAAFAADDINKDLNKLK